MRLGATLFSLSHPLAQGLTLLAIAAMVYLSPADLPLSGDEAMYAAVAKEVVLSGHPLDLRLNGLPYLNKPPFFFATVALAFRLFGIGDRTAQVAAGLFSVLAVGALFVACRLMFGRWETGFLAALVFLMTPEAIHWGRGVRLEGMLAFFSILSVAAVFGSLGRPAALPWAFLASGLGFLTKGPQSLFPLALLPLLWWRGNVFKGRAACAWTLVGAASLLVLVGPWIAWRWQTQGLFVDVYLRGQVASTLVGEGWPGRGPAWYLTKLARTYWPWAPFALAGLFALRRPGAGGFACRRADPDGALARRKAAAEAWGWYALLIFCVISISSLKKGRYLFPIYPPLAVFSALALEWAARRSASLRALLALAALVMAAAMLVVGDRPSAQARANASEALAVAGGLVTRDPVLLTASVARGRHGFGKILGFYARKRLLACRGDCMDELARQGGRGWVVMRRSEVKRVARDGRRGRVVLETRRLAVVDCSPSHALSGS